MPPWTQQDHSFRSGLAINRTYMQACLRALRLTLLLHTSIKKCTHPCGSLEDNWTGTRVDLGNLRLNVHRRAGAQGRADLC
mmetsp:Transcript_34419/g.90853  ORF Transcript_34419/g.90853 Transcript_34419/m.90853 type:complete len:81 (+) Transcript_34419:763-1005(+)